MLSLNIYSQNLESIGKEKPIKITGNIGTNQIFYAAQGIPKRRPPYMWIFSGNLNINLYGLDIPLSAFWSNQTRQYRQPFNQYGVSPRYKWATLHLGYRNLSFSSYTLAGYSFFGIGAELTPSIWRIGAMYGRLNKAVAEDTINYPNEMPAFRRMGYGFKVGVGKDGNFIDFILFKAKDDVSSLPYVPVTSNILPSENLVLSINAQKRFGKRIVIAAEYANSAFTRDTRSPNTESTPSSIFAITKGLFLPNQSTSYHTAFKSSINYSAPIYSVQLGYERIAPEYRTLGSYFFNNDLENITISPSLRLMEQRLQLGLNLGIQRNNVDGNGFSTNKRLLTSLNLNFTPTAQWNFGVQYSNFSSYNKISSRFNQFQNLDTLNFYQVNESANLNTGYNFQAGKNKHGLNLNFSYQTANETFGENVTDQKSVFINSNLGYRIVFAALNMTTTAGLNANNNKMMTSATKGFGPTLSVSKTFFDKKLRTALLTTYNQLYVDGIISGNAVNISINTGYTFQKKHSTTLTLLYLNKNARTSLYSNFSEWTGTLTYYYNF